MNDLDDLLDASLSEGYSAMRASTPLPTQPGKSPVRGSRRRAAIPVLFGTNLLVLVSALTMTAAAAGAKSVVTGTPNPLVWHHPAPAITVCADHCAMPSPTAPGTSPAASPSGHTGHSGTPAQTEGPGSGEPEPTGAPGPSPSADGDGGHSGPGGGEPSPSATPAPTDTSGRDGSGGGGSDDPRHGGDPSPSPSPS